RDAELSYPTAALRDLLLSHRRGLVRAREQLLAKRGPVSAQVVRKLVHRHPVDAGAALVLPHSLQRGLKVRALARPLHQVAPFRAPPSALPRSALLSGLHPYPPAGAPVAWTSEALCLRDARSFRSPLRSALRRDRSRLLRPLLTSHAAFAWPFQAQGEISP